MMGTEDLFSNDMMDTTVDPKSLGLVPRICFGLFDAVEAVDESVFEVHLSYLEIYNESVRDLLDPARSTVKVREHPKFGVYVKGLRTFKVQQSLLYPPTSDSWLHIVTCDRGLYSKTGAQFWRGGCFAFHGQHG